MSKVDNGSGPMAGIATAPAMGRSSQDYLKLLTRKLITAQEEERRRIARELHDDISQRLAVVSIELDQLASSDEGLKSELRQHVKTIQKNIEEIGCEIHDLSRQLHPSKLEHLGLVAAVNSLCREISAGRGFDIEFTVGKTPIPDQLPWDLSLCFYRVAQEALQNVARHSRATRAEVRLSGTGKSIRLVVSDNGDGFLLTEDRLAEGLGLTSMQERLSSVDGELRIVSHPGEGTAVEAVAPLPARNTGTDR